MGSNTSTKRMTLDERRKAIIIAGAELFFKNGYAGTSIDAIIKKAGGGSKRNFYTEFGGKEGLFRTLVTENIALYLSALEANLQEGRNVRETLLGMARCIVDSYSDPLALGLYRIVSMEGPRFPELGEIFLHNALGRVTAHVVRILEQAAERSEIPRCEYKVRAELFCNMLRSELFFSLVMGLRPPPDKDEMDCFIITVTDTFLHGILGQQTL